MVKKKQVNVNKHISIIIGVIIFLVFLILLPIFINENNLPNNFAGNAYKVFYSQKISFRIDNDIVYLKPTKIYYTSGNWLKINCLGNDIYCLSYNNNQKYLKSTSGKLFIQFNDFTGVTSNQNKILVDPNIKKLEIEMIMRGQPNQEVSLDLFNYKPNSFSKKILSDVIFLENGWKSYNFKVNKKKLYYWKGNSENFALSLSISSLNFAENAHNIEISGLRLKINR